MMQTFNRSPVGALRPRRRLPRILASGLVLALLAACQLPSQVARPGPAPPAAVQDPDTIERTAKEAYDRQDWTEAETQYVALARARPADAEPWFRLGNIYARSQRSELAVRAFREAVQRDPRHTRAWHNLAIVQLQQAVASFGELEKVTAGDDPLYRRSAEIRSAVEALIAPRNPEAR